MGWRVIDEVRKEQALQERTQFASNVTEIDRGTQDDSVGFLDFGINGSQVVLDRTGPVAFATSCFAGKAADTPLKMKIIQMDEAGCGALAGPLAAAAVILPPEPDTSQLVQVRDSKLLRPDTREALFHSINAVAISVGIGIVPS